MPIVEFMVGVKQTALAPGELIVAVTVPLLDGWQGYAKVGVRNAMVIAISGVCLAVDRPSRSVRIALGSVAPTIVRATDGRVVRGATARLGSGTIRAEDVAEFGRLAAAASRPITDHRSTADTAVTRSTSWRGACWRGRSRWAHERAVPAARERRRP